MVQNISNKTKNYGENKSGVSDLEYICVTLPNSSAHKPQIQSDTKK